MSYREELKRLNEELDCLNPETFITLMEQFIAVDNHFRYCVLSILKEAMLESARAGEEFCVLEFPDPSAEQEKTMLVIEEWLEAHDYDFEFESEWRKGKKYVTLTIHLWVE